MQLESAGTHCSAEFWQNNATAGGGKLAACPVLVVVRGVQPSPAKVKAPTGLGLEMFCATPRNRMADADRSTNRSE
jgi:hypothetical protein